MLLEAYVEAHFLLCRSQFPIDLVLALLHLALYRINLHLKRRI